MARQRTESRKESGKAVRLLKQFTTMPTYTQEPFNPNPPFPQWADFAPVYPHSMWGSLAGRDIKREYFMPSIENEYLRVTIAPDIGGRIWDIYDKIGKRHLANYNTGVTSSNAGFGYNYTVGGVEINYPLAHSPTTNCKREVSFSKEEDGTAAIIISEYERIWRTRWSVSFILHPGSSYLEQKVRIYNRSPRESRYMYWANCGFAVGDNTHFIYPEDTAAMHGMEKTTFSWPMWRHFDMTRFRTVPPQDLGLYFMDAREPYFGYYDTDDKIGLVHYSSLTDAPGKKFWTWGYNPPDMALLRKTHNTCDQVYIEMQSGRIAIQEHMDRLPPESECSWSERWYPIRDIGIFNGAGSGAALRADIAGGAQEGTRLNISAISNEDYPNAKISVMLKGKVLVEQPMPLTPRAQSKRELSLPKSVSKNGETVIVISDRVKGTIGKCILRAPNTRDCWREVVNVDHGVYPIGVDDIFKVAEEKARDWGNHNLKSYYEDVLKLDNAYGPAQRELGKLGIWRGEYDKALKHLDIARWRDPDSLEVRYYRGMALLGLNRAADAKMMFELAARYDWEARSRARLAEIAMREKDWPKALEELTRNAESQPRLTRCRGLRAICLRKLGRMDEAEKEIQAALAIDGQDPFLQFEAMFIRGGKKLPAAALKSLIEQVRREEPPLLEAALDYLGVELYEEACTVLQNIPSAGALAHFALAYSQAQLGQSGASKKSLATACKLDPAYQRAWAHEFIAILKWAIEQDPKAPRPMWHLGNLYMARRRTDEGIELWRQAEKLGEKHYLLFGSLGFYARNVGGSKEEKLEYFRKAQAAAPNDLYMLIYYAEALVHAGRKADAQAYLEGHKEALHSSQVIAAALLSYYLDQDDFEKFDAFCKTLKFHSNTQLHGPRRLWVRRVMKESLILIARGELEKALDILLNFKGAPYNISGDVQEHDVAREDDRRFYHIGCIYEKLGNLEKAREYWERSVAIPHFIGYEPSYTNIVWNQRYYGALSLLKLGRTQEAETYFDAMEAAARRGDLSPSANRALLGLVDRGRFAPDAEKDPVAATMVTMATRVER